MTTSPPPGQFEGYFKRDVPAEDARLTHTGPGTPMGEAMRRHWQPVCLSSQLKDLPVKVRILGEDLVALRTKNGQTALLHLHCCHRGASLEFGRITDCGIVCCYHGWHYAIDGQLIHAPAEPHDSPLLRKVRQGAYPTIERHGLVFAYFGAPDQRPAFPDYDTLNLPGVDLRPYALSHDCNWLQVHENLMDPLHAVFLHSRMGEIQLTEAWGEMPVTDWFEHGDRVCYLAARRIQEKVWVRFNEVGFPNFGQVAGFWEDGNEEKYFERVGATRWTVPIDDTHCWIFGLRHFSDALEVKGLGDPAKVGLEQLDIYGQTRHRSYEEMQRNTGDWEAEVSQRPIAIHALEHRGSSDRGVSLLRRHLARGIEQAPAIPAAVGEQVPTWTCNVVLHRPNEAETEDAAALLRLAHRIKEVVIAADGLPPPQRQSTIERQLRALSTAKA
jgi:tert-butyl alcohol monooxygenase / tert-amyl alcohol desaturase